MLKSNQYLADRTICKVFIFIKKLSIQNFDRPKIVKAPDKHNIECLNVYKFKNQSAEENLKNSPFISASLLTSSHETSFTSKSSYEYHFPLSSTL